MNAMSNTLSDTPSPQWDDQLTFEALGRPLVDVTFTVVDLETTGGSPAGGSMITEIGAVKVRGGEVVGEFQTLVNPGGSIPPFIASLTGITDTMVVAAPRIESVLPAFLEFAAGTVLVAHNAGFDVGFLRHFATQQGHDWPAFEVLDTVTIARRVVSRDEAPNCKLETLARLFRAETTPNHRALADARATVDVLHALIGRLGAQGVSTVEELRTWTTKVSPEQRRKRHLADDLPEGPGVYLFRDSRGTPLYVGTSRSVRRRVRTYFTASETRSRMGEMITLAERVDAIECATALEAQVRELRLIAEHKPRYNRRSRFPERSTFVKVTDEPWPRLSVVHKVRADDRVLGPFRSRAAALAHVESIHEAFPLRQCGGRMPRRGTGASCALAGLGRCLAPCVGEVLPETYLDAVDRAMSAAERDPSPVVEALTLRMERCATAERFEEAALQRDRMAGFVRTCARQQRLVALSTVPEVVAARKEEDGRWAVHVVRYGRLAAAGVIPRGADAHAFVDLLVAGAETVVPKSGPTPAASGEETEVVLRWLERDGVRIVALLGEWRSPLRGAGAHLGRVESVTAARDAATVPHEKGLPALRSRP